MAYWSTSTNYKLRVTLDVSTYCNAGCPQCDRTNPNGLGKADWLPLIQWSAEKFKQAIKPEDFSYIEHCSFVGSWGDPIMNKEIFQIIEYCIANGCKVHVETNGSIRDEEWWWDLGVMGGELLQVRFDVDGINQEMHSKYRRFTSLQKVLDNMYSFSQTKAKTASQTIVFKHNQDYLQEIEDLCRKYGSCFHTKVISDRFHPLNSKDGIFTFINENGEEEILEEANSHVLKKPFVSGAYRAKVVSKKVEEIAKSNVDSQKVSSALSELKKQKVLELDEKIQCRWAFPRNAIYIQNNGTLIPCCYVAWSHARIHLNNPENSNVIKERMKNKTLMFLMEESDGELNVFNHSIKDIISNSKWYTKVFPESLDSEQPMEPCVRHCSNRMRKKVQLREDS